MTKNEAIERMEYRIKTATDIAGNGVDGNAFEDMEMAINALKEIQPYRTLGTVKEIEKKLKMELPYMSIAQEKFKRELDTYKAIGTVEECREARERQMSKKPNIWGDGCDDQGNIIYDMYVCPNCDKGYEVGYDNYKFCPECGQAIDRSDLDKLV